MTLEPLFEVAQVLCVAAVIVAVVGLVAVAIVALMEGDDE